MILPRGSKSLTYGALSASPQSRGHYIKTKSARSRQLGTWPCPTKISRANRRSESLVANVVGSSDRTRHSTSTDLLKRPETSIDVAELKFASSSPPIATPLLVTFIVPEYVSRPDQTLVVLGSGKALGNWDPSRSIRLSPCHEQGHPFRWMAEVRIEEGWQGVAFEYKLATIEGDGVVYEPGSNRLLVADDSVTPVPAMEAGRDDPGLLMERKLLVPLQWGSCSCASPLTSGYDPTSASPSALPRLSSPDIHLSLSEGSAECTLLVPLPHPFSGLDSLSNEGVVGGAGGGGGMHMVLVGGHPALGDWDVSKGLPLVPLGPGSEGYLMPQSMKGLRGGGQARVLQATATLPLNQLIEAKIVLVRPSVNKSVTFVTSAPLKGEAALKGEEMGWEVVEWEPGQNRSILLCPPPGALLRPPSQPLHTSPHTTLMINQGTIAAPSIATGGPSGSTGSMGVKSMRQRTSGGRGYTRSLTPRGADPALAELLGTDLSSWDSDSEEGPVSNILPFKPILNPEGPKAPQPPSVKINLDTKAGPSSVHPSIPWVKGGEGQGVKGSEEGGQGGDYLLVMHWGTSALTQPIFRPLLTPTVPTLPSPAPLVTSRLHVTLPCHKICLGSRLVLVGSHPKLGSWDPNHGQWGVQGSIGSYGAPSNEELVMAMGLLTATLLSLRTPPSSPSSPSSSWSMEGAGVVGHQGEVEEVEELKGQVRALEVKVEERDVWVAELTSTLEVRSEALEVLQGKLAAHLSSSQGAIDDRVQMERARMLQELARSRAEYESKILNVQQSYESKILDLQQHESKVIAMQQQHDSVIRGIEAEHDKALRVLEGLQKEAEIKARDFESRLLLECRRRARDLNQYSAEINRLTLEAAQKLATQSEELESKQATAMRSLQETHDLIVEDLIARQAISSTGWEAQRQELLRRCQSLTASKAEVEGRALILAKSLALRSVDLEIATRKAFGAEAARSLSERERDRLSAQVARLEGELAAARRQGKPPSSAPNRFVESKAEMTNRVISASSFSPRGPFGFSAAREELVPCKCPVWALRPVYQSIDLKPMPMEP